MAGQEEGPAGVWKLVLRADDLVKYAQNRDQATAFAQARDLLEKASEAAGALQDRGAAEQLAAQIRTRLQDLERLMAPEGG